MDKFKQTEFAQKVAEGSRKTGAAIKEGAKKTGAAMKEGATKVKNSEFGQKVAEGARKTGEAMKDGAQKVKEKSAPALEKAKEHLLLSFIPTSIPCRETERREVYDYLRYSIKQGGNGSPLYISGMPGTGKTATVREVIRELQGELNFKVVSRIPDNG